MNVNKLEKFIELDRFEIIRFQIFTYCYFEKITVNDAALNYLTLLCSEGERLLSQFCTEIADLKIFTSAQSVRNIINEHEQLNLVIKIGKNKKKVKFNSNIPIVKSGNILLDYKILHRESKEEQSIT